MQTYTTGWGIGWYSIIELMVDGQRGDIHGYDWWVFDIVFTKDLDLEDPSQGNNNWLLFILGGAGWETYITQDSSVIRGGQPFEGLDVYDEQGNRLVGMPQKNVRYTVAMDIQKAHESGQYCVLGIFTQYLTTYIGNNIVCSDEYYRQNIRSRFSSAAPAQSASSDAAARPTVTAEVAYIKNED